MYLPNLADKVFLSKCMSVTENKTKQKQSKTKKLCVSTVLETLSFLTQNVT